MQKKRTDIPKKTRETILKEYHHKCALGHANPPAPELHHIDGDPSNHDLWNILPLCPNCHSSKLNPRILSVFRKYKRSEILSVEFEQLLSKAAFIFDLSANDYFPFCFAPGEDLVAFVRQLKKGKYYAPKIDKLIRATPEQDPTLEEDEALMSRWHCPLLTANRRWSWRKSESLSLATVKTCVSSERRINLPLTRTRPKYVPLGL